MPRYQDKIVIDTETTGFLEADSVTLDRQPHIIEIYAMRVSPRGKVIDEFESFLQPPIELPKHITKITGIDQSMLDGQPVFVEKYKELVDFFIGSRELIAHNLPFDAGVIWVELSRIGKEFNFPWCPVHTCTIEKSFHLENKRINLSKLHEYATGKPHKDGAHRAKADVLALFRCYQWLEEKGKL